MLVTEVQVMDLWNIQQIRWSELYLILFPSSHQVVQVLLQDLAYISERILAMSFPAQDLEAWEQPQLQAAKSYRVIPSNTEIYRVCRARSVGLMREVFFGMQLWSVFAFNLLVCRFSSNTSQSARLSSGIRWRRLPEILGTVRACCKHGPSQVCEQSAI